MSSIVLNVTCVTRGYVGYTRGHLHRERVERRKLINQHERQSTLVFPERNFTTLLKCYIACQGST